MIATIFSFFFFSFFLAVLGALLRLVAKGYNQSTCSTCGASGELLCCESCPRSFHLLCVEPPLRSLPPAHEPWFCPSCEGGPGGELLHATGPMGPVLASLAEQQAQEFVLPRAVRAEYAELTPAQLRKPKVKMPSCKVCGEKCRLKGETATCHVCRAAHHLWCVDPPLLHAPLRSWTCPDHAHFALSPYTHILPQRTIALQFEQEPLSPSESRRKGRAFRAVRQEVAEQRDVLQGMGRLQTELLEQNGRALAAKAAAGGQRVTPDQVVAEERLKQMQEGADEQVGAGDRDEAAKELREYASRTQAVLRRAKELGVSLKVPSFMLEDAVLGRVPTLAELETVSPAVLAQVDPLLLQFLAWQRLMQLAEKRDGQPQPPSAQQIDAKQKMNAAVVLQEEIARMQQAAVPRKKILTEAMQRHIAAREWASGKVGLGSFLNATAAMAITEGLELPALEDAVLGDAALAPGSGASSGGSGGQKRQKRRPRASPPSTLRRERGRGDEEEDNSGDEDDEHMDSGDDENFMGRKRVREAAEEMAPPKRRVGRPPKAQQQQQQQQPRPLQMPQYGGHLPPIFTTSRAVAPSMVAAPAMAQQQARPNEVARLSWSNDEGRTFGMSLILRRGQTVRVGREGSEKPLDVDLTKAWDGKPLVSRLHAELRHNIENDRLELLVLGKNGASSLGKAVKYHPDPNGRWIDVGEIFWRKDDNHAIIDFCGCLLRIDPV